MAGFQTIKTQKPWYRRPGSLAALGLFAFLGGCAWFLLKGSEATLLGRVQAGDPISPVCAYAIGWRGLREDATREAFEQLLASGATDKPAPEEVRRACAYALGRTKQSQVARFLIDALKADKSVPVRCAAARGLGRTQEPIGSEPLMEAINDNEADVRAAAAEGCQYMGDKRAIDKLVDRVEDPVPTVRRACHEALVALTGTSFDGIDEKAQWRRWRETH